MENLARTLDTRLYTVKFGKNKNFSVSGIIAASLDEAKTKAETNAKDKAVEITSEPIFEGSLGLEGNGIFEISIKGTNETNVNKFTELLARFIGGMAVDFELGDDNDTDIGRINKLTKFIAENEISVECF